MNLNQISHHLKTMNLTRAGPPPPRFWWHAGKPPDLPIQLFYIQPKLQTKSEEQKSKGETS